jgi:PAS domain S-box-containing protein
MNDGSRDDGATALFHATSSDAWLAAIVDSSDDAIIGKTLDSVIRSWNTAASAMFGHRATDIIGKPIYALIPPELHHEEPEIIARLVRGDRVRHYETVRLRADGSRIDVSISVSPIRDKRGQIVGAAKIARDISEAKRLQQMERELTEQLQELTAELETQIDEGQALQEELEQTNEELIRSLAAAESARGLADSARRQAEDANAAKSQFLTTMSHELRTPLNAIAGYVELLDLEIRGPITPEQRRDLARIKQSEESLLRLIDEVLTFARLESGRTEYQFEPVRVDDVLARLESFIAPRLIQKGLAYHFQPCGNDAFISTDRAKLEQIMLNLLSNAVKFTATGRVDVECGVSKAMLRIDVRDTGRGIPPNLLESIFDPFVQADHSLTRTTEGTGLGLSISRQLARGMGGDVTVESVEGRGSIFTLTLPTA